MSDRQSRLLLCTLLLLYVAGRILQLFADVVPHLVIVCFHVIPPAAFALVHGARTYGRRASLVFAGVCLGIATLFESIGLHAGIPFGRYEFTGLMGPKVYGLPILLALAYVGMGYLSWIVAGVLFGRGSKALRGREIVLLPLLASLVMTVWDLSMEAVWADVDRGWIWWNGGPYYGVPLSNFFGWLITCYVIYQLFALYLTNLESRPPSASPMRLAVAFYAVSAVGNLLAVAPPSLGSVFVDATGKRWLIHDILWTSRLISIFLMLPVAVIAWLRITKWAAAREPQS